MIHQYSYEGALQASARINWQIADIIGDDRRLDFSRKFMPESLARVERPDFLNESERLTLNQIRGNAYLCIFGLVEEFILPFVLDHARPHLQGDDYRTRAMLQFASEEAKHIHLFKEFRRHFEAGFGTDCGVIGPHEAIAAEILRHHPLAGALAILHIEWVTQRHFLDSIKDDRDLDPQFKSLLRHHWMEEAQHARLDTLMVETIAAGCSPDEICQAVAEYIEIGGFLDGRVKQQTVFDLAAFEEASGRNLADAERETFMAVQHQANRWTYIGSGMTHPNFLETVGRLDAGCRRQIEEIAPAFC
ncbi:MAG: diiron oxygenase [Rhodospirillaceae bacterium]|nr:diiron oxygenase [Rhodospirillaceae bacterium]